MANDYFNHTTTITRLSLAASSVVNAIFAAVQAGFAKLPGKEALELDMVTYVVDTGAADAVAVALTPTLTSYVTGLKVRVKILATNTGSATLNIDSLGVVPIKRLDGNDVEATDLTAGDIHEFIYDGTNFVMISTSRVVMARAASPGAVPVSLGGTGATTAVGALTNLGAMPLAGGTVSGTITISGDGEELHAPAITINPDAAAATDRAQVAWENKSDVQRALTHYDEATDTWNLSLYDTGGVYQAQAAFVYDATYSSVKVTLGVIKASSVFLGPGTNEAAVLRNTYGTSIFFSDVSGIDTQAGSPSRVYISNGASTTTWFLNVDGTSDARLKENIRPTQVDALSEIMQIEFVAHDWNDLSPTPGTHSPINVVAQQILTISEDLAAPVPRARNAPHDFDALGTNDRPLLMRAGRAIQQLQAQIDDLRAEINTLKGA